MHKKHRFTIIVDHLRKFRVISNMPKKKDRSVRSETIRSEFVTTPAMRYVTIICLIDTVSFYRF